MDIKHTPTEYSEADDVFVETTNNGVQSTYFVGSHPSFRRSSSVTTSQTPFIRRESSVRRFSESPGITCDYEPMKHKTFPALSVIVVIIVLLGAVVGILFYRLEVKNNDLERRLLELQDEFETLKLTSPRKSQSEQNVRNDVGNCECPSEKNNIENLDPNPPDVSSSILQCCVQDSKQVQTMIEEAFENLRHEILKRIEKLNSNSNHIRRRGPAAFAHVNGKTNSVVQANNRMKGYMTYWREIPQLENRVSYHRGRIIIQHAGVYYVYSQIYFYGIEENERSLTNNTQSSSNEPMLHETCLNGNAIIKSAVPFRDFTSKYHGGLFKLNRGDRITVRVSSNDYHANMDPELSFFGVYSLDDSAADLTTAEPYPTTMQ